MLNKNINFNKTKQMQLKLENPTSSFREINQ